MNVTVYINNIPSYNLKIKKNYTVSDVKELLQSIPNFKNYNVTLFLNDTDVLNVFDTNEYDNLKFKTIWKNLDNPYILLEDKQTKLDTKLDKQKSQENEVSKTQQRTGYLTGIKDLDREVLNNLSDEDFLNFCQVNKDISRNVCDDTYFRLRTELKYAETIPYKKSNTSWRNHYLNIIRYIDELQRDFKYVYNKKDLSPEYAYKVKSVVPPYTRPKTVDDLFYWVINTGNVNLVKYLIDIGKTPNKQKVVEMAKQLGYPGIARYLENL